MKKLIKITIALAIILIFGVGLFGLNEYKEKIVTDAKISGYELRLVEINEKVTKCSQSEPYKPYPYNILIGNKSYEFNLILAECLGMGGG